VFTSESFARGFMVDGFVWKYKLNSMLKFLTSLGLGLALKVRGHQEQ